MIDPFIVEITRGNIVESVHAGAFVVSDSSGDVFCQSGEVDKPVFPRSAIKALQALPMVASGAAEDFGFSPAEIALCCASHGGEVEHVAAAASMLAKIDASEEEYECGAHWPTYQRATNTMIAACERPRQIHNNCSGKHAGMLAFARKLGAEPAGYVNPEHPVQNEIAKTIGRLCDVNLDKAPCGIDGCSVPTWAIPLRYLALGFARFGDGSWLEEPFASAALQIIKSVRAHPFMVAGTGKFCTDLMKAVPRVFLKTGAVAK